MGAIKKFFLNKKFFKIFLNEKLVIDSLDFSPFFYSAVIESYINRSKLLIYDDAISKFCSLYKLTNFHLYLFEYNFGFFLTKTFKKKGIDIIGYQHGIFDKNLMWLDLLIMNKSLDHYPTKIVSNQKSSMKLYKLLFKKQIIKYSLKKKKLSYLSKSLNIFQNSNNVLFISGTHDIQDIYNFCVHKIYKKSKNKYFIKTHPKNKFLFKDQYNLKKINNINSIKFKKIYVSNTSTIKYDFQKLKKSYSIFKPAYKLI